MTRLQSFLYSLILAVISLGIGILLVNHWCW